MHDPSASLTFGLLLAAALIVPQYACMASANAPPMRARHR